MSDLDELRRFYNHTIHPELMRLDRKRHHLLRFLAVSFIGILFTVFLQIKFNLLVLTLVLIIPIGFFIAFIFYELDKFKSSFKPKIVNLLLDFIDNNVDFTDLKYYEKGEIKPEVFKASRLFNSATPDYEGEDYITGRIREQFFEMSELAVKEFSPVRNRLDDVFRGVFLHSMLNRPLNGEILVLPRHKRQFLSTTIKSFTVNGSYSYESKNPVFKEHFLVYTTKNANIDGFMNEGMQESILKFREKTKRDLYISIVGSGVYIAVLQPKDLLEPAIWQSNVSFELILEFYKDLMLILGIVRDIDGAV
jgi:hypothetical protein